MKFITFLLLLFLLASTAAAEITFHGPKSHGALSKHFQEPPTNNEPKRLFTQVESSKKTSASINAIIPTGTVICNQIIETIDYIDQQSSENIAGCAPLRHPIRGTVTIIPSYDAPGYTYTLVRIVFFTMRGVIVQYAVGGRTKNDLQERTAKIKV